MEMKLLLILPFLRLVESEDLTTVIPTLGRRIVRGYNCSAEEYSYLASISQRGRIFCGGSLVSRRWVLTAAHCCESMAVIRFSDLKVHLGLSIWLKNPKQTASVDRLVPHEDFNHDTGENDICLIKLTRKVETSRKVKITKLVLKNQLSRMIKDNECSKSLILGFGHQIYKPKQVEFQKNPSNVDIGYNDHVQCGKVALVSREDCQMVTRKFIPESAICAQDPHIIHPTTDACQGDSGGPLICNGLQIGLVSYGFGCGDDLPGVYSRLDIHEEFIREITSDFRDEDTTDSKASGMAFLGRAFYMYLYYLYCHWLNEI